MSIGKTRATARCTVAALLLALTQFGCAFGEMRWSDPLDREVTLEDAQYRYTVLVRWNDLDRASAFVDPAMRSDFLTMVPNFRDLRITEYESEPVEMTEEQTATLKVTYYVYSPSSPIETTITETQEWYRDSGVGNSWHVRPSFTGIDELLAVRTRR